MRNGLTNIKSMDRDLRAGIRIVRGLMVVAVCDVTFNIGAGYYVNAATTFIWLFILIALHRMAYSQQRTRDEVRVVMAMHRSVLEDEKTGPI